MRDRTLRRWTCALAVSLTAIVAPTAASAAQPDTLNVAGTDSFVLSAQVGPSGGPATGSGTSPFQFMGHSLTITATVTCLQVTGPDAGAGTPTAPTTARVGVDLYVFSSFIRTETLEFVDHGGNGADTEGAPLVEPAHQASCDPNAALEPQGATVNRAVIFDAPLKDPTSTSVTCAPGRSRRGT